MTDEHSATDDSPCDDALHEIYEYLNGEMTDEHRALITKHLDDCSPCLEAFDFENELRLLVARRCQEEAPEDLRRRIADAIAGCDTEPTTEFEG